MQLLPPASAAPPGPRVRTGYIPPLGSCAGDNGGQTLDLCYLTRRQMISKKHQKTRRMRAVNSHQNQYLSQACTARLLLLTPGRQGAPEPAHTRQASAATLRRGLCRPVGAGAKQPYYSYPEGGLSLLTGRHKYSSTSSPRVNGCPSGCSRPYRRAAHVRCGALSVATARSFMVVVVGTGGGTRRAGGNTCNIQSWNVSPKRSFQVDRCLPQVRKRAIV